MEFEPHNEVSTLAASAQADAKQPEVKLPEKGDTMRIAVQPWGHFIVIDKGFCPSNGMKVIELEVKDIKEVKIRYE